jgi:hypothetical protein
LECFATAILKHIEFSQGHLFLSTFDNNDSMDAKQYPVKVKNEFKMSKKSSSSPSKKLVKSENLELKKEFSHEEIEKGKF